MLIDDIANKVYGGPDAMREALGASETAFANWRRRGGIPGRFHGVVLEAARKRRAGIGPEDLQITRRDRAA